MSADKKLVHIVKKLLPSNAEDSPNVDYIFNCTRTQHREYQRKDPTKLKRQIQNVISHLEKSEGEASGSASKKRPLEQEKDEDEYEKKARQLDMQREQQHNETNSLNDSLVQGYRKVQQARDIEARAKDEEGREKTHSKKNGKRKKSGKRSTSNPGAGDGNMGDIGPTQAVTRPSERYSDLGGMNDVLKQIRQLVEYPLVRPELYRHLGVDPPRGVLLRGPPGCGKTHLANAIAGQLGVPFFRVSAPELVSGMSGESEARIRDLFQAASDSAPAIIFLDELDAIAPKRSDSGSSRGMEKRMVAQLLTSLDMLDPKYNRQQAAVIVLGATNRSDSIDAALRRAGRFDKEILLGVPDEDARIGILKTMTKEMKLSGNFDFKVLARLTPGYVGADVRSLTKEAAVIAINRIFKDVLKDQKLSMDHLSFVESSSVTEDIITVTPLTSEEMEPCHVTMDDFLAAVPHVQPSSKREGFATVPGVTWDDIGALGSIREELALSVLEPIRNPEKFQALGIPLPAGVMLYGPPGCGKTLLAKAIANESGANFISVKGPELLDKYVGESERSVRLVFERARSSSPCIVFFDELDSLCPKRGSDGGGGGGVSERVVNQLLTEMDGLDSRRSVFVIAATNRPELIDPAMMRP
jgi:ribosome biogenesis ATPase